jgi:hypothetical protein
LIYEINPESLRLIQEEHDAMPYEATYPTGLEGPAPEATYPRPFRLSDLPYREREFRVAVWGRMTPKTAEERSYFPELW